jgi:hypothetical protein
MASGQLAGIVIAIAAPPGAYDNTGSLLDNGARITFLATARVTVRA